MDFYVYLSHEYHLMTAHVGLKLCPGSSLGWDFLFVFVFKYSQFEFC